MNNFLRMNGIDSFTNLFENIFYCILIQDLIAHIFVKVSSCILSQYVNILLIFMMPIYLDNIRMDNKIKRTYLIENVLVLSLVVVSNISDSFFRNNFQRILFTFDFLIKNRTALVLFNAD